MMQTILFFKGIYDTLDLFTDELCAAFERMGYPVFVYDARNQEVSKKLLLSMLAETARAEHTDDLFGKYAVVTFNNLGYNLDLAGGTPSGGAVGVKEKRQPENVWECYNIPYINILMDHPFHYDKPLRSAPATSVVLCTDSNHVKYIRRFFKNIRQTGFLPHAGVELPCKHKPLRDRGIDVLYAGALPIYTVDYMIPDLSSIREVDAEAMAGDVLRELVSHPEKTTEQAIEEYVRAVGSGLPDGQLHDLIVKMRFLDSYATSFFREQAVRLLVESGIRVTAYGTGWDRCDWSGSPYLTYGGKVLAPQILPLMNNSKLVLSTMTWFKAGSHDRVFNGMLAGSAVVSDDSSYMRREFKDGRELTMFSLPEIAALPDKVCDLFGHLDKAQEIADCGYEAARRDHTWQARAEEIRELYL